MSIDLFVYVINSVGAKDCHQKQYSSEKKEQQSK